MTAPEIATTTHPAADDDGRRRLLSGKTLALTTYRRDGRAVTTPVWFHQEPDGSLVVTGARTAHRHARIGHDPRVAVAPCTARGQVTGEPTPGTAELLDDEGLSRALAAKRRRYPMFRLLWVLRPSIRDQAAVRIRLDP